MLAASIWFLLAAMTFVLEVMARRGYFLTVTFASFIAGAAGLIGADWLLQINIALLALTAALLLVGWRATLRYQPTRPAWSVHFGEAMTTLLRIPKQRNHLYVAHWEANGSTQVFFQGRVCRAVLSKGAHACAGNFYIQQVHDNMLVLANERRSKSRMPLLQNNLRGI